MTLQSSSLRGPDDHEASANTLIPTAWMGIGFTIVLLHRRQDRLATTILDDKLVANLRMQHTDLELQCSIMSFHVEEYLYNLIAPNFDFLTECQYQETNSQRPARERA